MDRVFRYFFLFFLLLVFGCTPVRTGEEVAGRLDIRAVSFGALPGWGRDDMQGFLQAFRKSCVRILKQNPSDEFGGDVRFGTYGDWQAPCKRLQSGNVRNAKAFVEKYFRPYEVSSGGEVKGLFTGYYEAFLNGSLRRHGKYKYPLRKRPDDLVMVDLGEFRDDLKGRRIAGRVVGGRLRPYESRAEIVAGKLPDSQDRALVWVDDKVDAFFVQIQGSGVVELDNGEVMRIGYAGQNGHSYYAIGRELVKRGFLDKDEVSMQSIRKWLEENPHKADEVMNTNGSYVFFRELKGDFSGPEGGEGVSLTVERSLAVDHSLMPYGVPLWLNIDGAGSRMMVVQDTGGAIRGAVRGDIFFGSGRRAEEKAGKMKAQGRYWVLIPKSVQ